MRNEIRIIAGAWRSRRLRFPATEGLRPTPDRVRETVFNWLRDVIEGARCLDLFAGSGALGFEAASRGAASVVQIDATEKVCAALRQNCSVLAADDRIRVIHDQARRYLAGPAEPFDVVFLDPPFRRGWPQPLCQMLEFRGWLAPAALVYLESERELRLTDLPANWSLYRHGEAGEVAYALYQRTVRSGA
jgi:16S rRNA (guanine966-N2)-methyltransferase